MISMDTPEVASMALGDDLDLYQKAYLCGGPERVALVALVALCQDGRITISPARHRVSAVTREPADPVETAALEAIPEVGCVLGPLSLEISGSPAVTAVRATLVKDGLLSRWRQAGRTSQGRKVRDLLLTGEPAPGPQAIAVNGAAGITDARLHRLFTTPDPEPLGPLTERPRRMFGGSGGRDTPGLEGYVKDGYLADDSSGGSSSDP
jgi:hypothetical protein